MSSAGASILAVGYLIPLVYFTYSLFAGEKAAADPWGAQGLEWEIPAASDGELCGDADRHARDASVRTQRGGRHCLTATCTRALSGAAHSPPVGEPCSAHPPHPHHPKLQHHFDDMSQQLEASTLGMWVFLVTEIMFFGGLFMAYPRTAGPIRPPSRRRAHLNKFWGAVNTIVLIVSSLTMAMAVRAAHRAPSRRRRCSGWSRR